MKSLHFLVLSLITFAIANTDLHTTSPKLDPAVPIYLGDVFWPPTMTFIAWLPSEDNTPLEWCYKATDASDHRLFSLGGVDALQIHDYFFEQAYITREGKKFADCYVTPESVRIGACEGVLDWECDGGHKFTGPGTRRWSCWVIEEEKRKIYEKAQREAGPLEAAGERLTDALFTPSATVTGAMVETSILTAFTPGVTGI